MKSLKQLCEGSWGYEPDQNDGTLDLRGELWTIICESIYDRCNKYITVKPNTSDADLAAWSWEALGALEYFIDALTKCDGFSLGSSQEWDVYYYWYRLKDKKHKDIFRLYEKCLRNCATCEKWISDWKEPEAMKQSLEHRRSILETWKRLDSEYTAHERILKQKLDSSQTVTKEDF